MFPKIKIMEPTNITKNSRAKSCVFVYLIMLVCVLLNQKLKLLIAKTNSMTIGSMGNQLEGIEKLNRSKKAKTMENKQKTMSIKSIHNRE